MDANISSPNHEYLRITSLADADLPIEWRSHARSRGLLVIVIHGMWCPSCLERLVWLRRRHTWLAGLGVGVLAVSVEHAEHVAAFQQSLMAPLPFTLAADAGAAFSRALGLYDEVSRTTRSALLLVDCAGGIHLAQMGDHSLPEQAQLQSEIELLPAC